MNGPLHCDVDQCTVLQFSFFLPNSISCTLAGFNANYKFQAKVTKAWQQSQLTSGTFLKSPNLFG